jgi:hypothetical protein
LIEINQKSSYFSIEKNIEKSRKITKVSTSLEKSWSPPKSTVLAELIETKSRYLNLDRDIWIVETNFWKPSRLSIMSRSTFENRRDRESWSIPRRDKSRPPRLLKCHLYFIAPIVYWKRTPIHYGSWCFNTKILQEHYKEISKSGVPNLFLATYH